MSEIEEWLRHDNLRLVAGEMTAQEIRTAQAVGRAVAARLQAENARLRERAEMARRERDEVRAALGELVELKELKDQWGKCSHYLLRQPKAWERARAVLAGQKEEKS